MIVLLEPGSIMVYIAVYIRGKKISVCMFTLEYCTRWGCEQVHLPIRFYTRCPDSGEVAIIPLDFFRSPCGVLLLELIPGHQGSGNISSFFPLLLLVYKHTYISTHTKTS
jgi:hypothetical protein